MWAVVAVSTPDPARSDETLPPISQFFFFLSERRTLRFFLTSHLSPLSYFSSCVVVLTILL